MNFAHQDEINSISFGNFLDEKTFQDNSKGYDLPTINFIYKDLHDNLKLILPDGSFLLSRNIHPIGYKFSLGLSHDIDYLDKRFINRLKMTRNVLKLIKQSATSSTDWNEMIKFIFSNQTIQLSNIKRVEEKFSANSVLNFCGYDSIDGDSTKDKFMNPAYRINEVKLDNLENFFEIGVHGSTKVFDDKSRYAEELNRVRGLGNCVGTRQHMLSFSFNSTFRIQSELGIRYDTSIGFNDKNGYRSNCALLYRPLDEKMGEFAVWELPLVFMDSVFTKKGILKSERFVEEANSIADTALKTNNFKGSVCWHDSAFYNGSDLEKAYEAVLATFEKKGAYMAAPIEIVKFQEGIEQVKVNDNYLFIPNEMKGKVSLLVEQKDKCYSIGANDGFDLRTI
jgi:hypothetical protein